MTEIQPERGRKRIVLSEEALGQICPETYLKASSSRMDRTIGFVRRWSRILGVRLWFLGRKWQPIRCRIVQARLRMKLVWLRFRHRNLR